jgi:hypothetical protein
VVKKTSPEDKQKLVAAVDLIGRTGASEIQIRHSPEDEPPISWTAIARWGSQWECAAAMNPLLAVFRLCDQVIDGGECTHCEKPSGFDSNMDAMPMNQFVCWYQWDPSTKSFKRGCD